MRVAVGVAVARNGGNGAGADAVGTAGGAVRGPGGATGGGLGWRSPYDALYETSPAALADSSAMNCQVTALAPPSGPAVQRPSAVGLGAPAGASTALMKWLLGCFAARWAKEASGRSASSPRSGAPPPLSRPRAASATMVASRAASAAGPGSGGLLMRGIW